MPRPSGRKNGGAGMGRGQVEEEVVEVHRDVGEREQPELALALEEGGQRRQRVARSRAASRTAAWL